VEFENPINLVVLLVMFMLLYVGILYLVRLLFLLRDTKKVSRSKKTRNGTKNADAWTYISAKGNPETLKELLEYLQKITDTDNIVEY